MPWLRWLLCIIGFPQTLVGISKAETIADFEGVWAPPLLSLTDINWRVEDLYCFRGCAAPAIVYMQDLLADPENDTRPFLELWSETRQVESRYFVASLSPLGLEASRSLTLHEDGAIRCQPFGFARQALSPYLLQIVADDTTLRIRYEEWSAERRIDLGSQTANATASPLGTSKGVFDGTELVVTTDAIREDILWPAWRIRHSDRLKAVEVYNLDAGQQRLWLRLHLSDSEMFRKPIEIVHHWVRVNDDAPMRFDCSSFSGPDTSLTQW
jgi:hypothetical protein